MSLALLFAAEVVSIAILLSVLCRAFLRTCAPDDDEGLATQIPQIPQIPRLSRCSFGAAADERRASALLHDVLDAREYQQVLERGFLDVTSPHYAQRVYRIPRWDGPVTVYERGRAIWDLCLRPAEPLPGSDVILLHKLMIQASEEDYLASANQSPSLLTGRRLQ